MSDSDIEKIGITVGRNLRGLMQSRKVTRQALAEKVGGSKMTITKICQGYGCNTSLWTIIAIADVFDMAVDELCREEFYPQ